MVSKRGQLHPAVKFRSLISIVVVAALTLGVVFLFKPATPEAPKPAAVAKPAAQKPDAPKAAGSQVVAPVVKPADKPGDKPTATAAKPATADPQKELNTALTDITDLLAAGDLYGAMMRYLPPDMITQMMDRLPESERANFQQMVQQQMSDPEAQQGIQMMVQVVDSMKTMAPEMNAAGDKATYQISDPSGQDTKVVPFSFQKIDGKWYVSPEMMKGGF